MGKFPPVTQEVKPLAHLLKLADEHEDRNIVVAYWARMSACLLALRLVPGKKSPETAELIRALLDWLEETKKANSDNDGITSETTAQALIEEYALRLFEHADQQDKAEIFNKNTVKTFYTAGLLMDVLDQFGTIEDELKEKRKYAKWKAAYIHNCLKAGEVPLPGPARSVNDTTGIVPSNTLSEDELKNFTKYTGPIDIKDIQKPQSPNVPPDNPQDNLTPFFPAKPGDDSNFSHAPASSPITPIAPTNPTPFNTPAPVQPVSPGITMPSVSPAKPLVSIDGQYTPNPEDIQKAQKFCKFATSALNYDDVKSAMDYLNKAMNLLQTGNE